MFRDNTGNVARAQLCPETSSDDALITPSLPMSSDGHGLNKCLETGSNHSRSREDVKRCTQMSFIVILIDTDRYADMFSILHPLLNSDSYGDAPKVLFCYLEVATDCKTTPNFYVYKAVKILWIHIDLLTIGYIFACIKYRFSGL